MDSQCIQHEHTRALSSRYSRDHIILNRTRDSQSAGLWRHPRNQTSQYTDIEYWTNLAKIVEEGKFHGLFIADVLSHYGIYKGPGNIDPSLPGAAQFPITDPLCVPSNQPFSSVTAELT